MDRKKEKKVGDAWSLIRPPLEAEKLNADKREEKRGGGLKCEWRGADGPKGIAHDKKGEER